MKPVENIGKKTVYKYNIYVICIYLVGENFTFFFCKGM